jgi:hypothetical protein
MSSKDKLRLVPIPERQESRPPNTRLTIGSYIADILVDPRSYATLDHWIAQRIGSAEIIGRSQENSFEDAEQEAREYLRNLTEDAAVRKTSVC